MGSYPLRDDEIGARVQSPCGPPSEETSSLPSGIRPYYDSGGIVIYNADCRDVMPSLEPVELVITDPPYPGMKGKIDHLALGGVGKHHTPHAMVGDPWLMGLDWMPAAWELCTLGMIVFCSYHSVPEVAAQVPEDARVALLTWYKRNSPPAVANVPRFTTEQIWLFKKAPGLRWRELKTTMFDVPMLSAGCMATERLVDGNGVALHPTQKPLGLMQTLLAIGGQTILDPFCGTGTTLVAAKRMGRSAIGIERDEKYAEIAANRLAQQVMDFGTTEAVAVQEGSQLAFCEPPFEPGEVA